MKEIELTQGYKAIVDDEDFEYLNQWKWYKHNNKHNKYAARCTTMDGRKKYLFMHRVIMNAQSGLDIDHINHNGLDNRKENLRSCNRSQNNQNMRAGYGKSKYKGVCYYKKIKRYAAFIKKDKKTRFLGNYKSELDAAKAYDNAARNLFGEFAYLNMRDQ